MPRANQLSATAPVAGAVLPVAKTALDAGQLETAKRLYRRLLDVDPQSFPARMGLGEVAHQRRDGAQAMRWFLAALANATTVTQRHDALLHHGRAALDAGQLEHAQASFARLTDPQEAASNEYVAYGLNGVGLTLLLSGDLRSSVTLLEQAVDRLPGDKKLRDNLARALKMLAEDVADASSPDDDPPGAAAAAAQATPRPGAPRQGELQSAADRIERAVARFEEAAERLAEAPARSDSAPAAQTPTPPARTAAAHSGTPDLPAQTPAPTAATPEPADAQPPAPPAETPDPAAQTPVPSAATPTPAPQTLASAIDTPDSPSPSAPTPTQTPGPPSEQPSAQATETPLASLPRGSPGFLVVEGDRRFVQMGAYGTAAKANALAQRLQRVTEQSVTVAERGGLHRVRIGPLRTQDALRALVGALQEAGYGDVRMAGQRSQRVAEATETGQVEPQARKTETWQAFAVRVDGETFLQIGAFAAHAAAMARATELRGLLATPVRVDAGTLPGGKAAHRVRIGPLRAEADLAAVVEALAAVGRELVMPKGTRVATATSTPAGDAPSPVLQDPGIAAIPSDKEQSPSPAEPRSAEAPSPETLETPATAPETSSLPPETSATPAPEPPAPETSSRPPEAPATDTASPPAAAPATPAPQQTPAANDGTAAAVEEVVEAALAAAEQVAAAKRGDRAEQPLPAAAESPSEPPVLEETLLARVRAEVITQDEGVFIQIGDYHARADADDLASRMRALTAEAVQVLDAQSANAPAYRVRLGPVETDADYEALVAAVASLGFVVQ